MTGFDAQADSYILQVNNDVVGQNTPNSIDPGDVGSIGIDLANLLKPYVEKINNFTFYTGTGAPLSSLGEEGDYYLRTNGGSTIAFYRKDVSVWALQMTLPLGIVYNDGILVGLRTQIDVANLAVYVSSGNWAINNVIYGKSIPTTINYLPQEVGSNRIDTIYADTLGQILYLAGAPSPTPVKPTLPANTIEVDSIYVPADGTGNPYLFSTGASTEIQPSKFVFTTADLDDTTYPGSVVLPFVFADDTKTFGGMIRVNVYDTDDLTLLSYYFLTPTYDTVENVISGFSEKIDHMKIFVPII